MSSFRPLLSKFRVTYVLGFATMCLLPIGVLLSGTMGYGVANAQEDGPPPARTPESRKQAQAQGSQAQQPQASGSNYDKAIFQKPMVSDQIAFLSQFTGVAAKDVIRDKQFRKLMKSFVPDCMFHYGSDMPLMDALDLVFKGSALQVQIRDGRYMTMSGLNGPYLAGRGVLWIDMQEGIGLGGFYFHPTNGEPTPSVNVFSRQVLKEDYLKLSQLPPAFAEDLVQWSEESRVPPLTTRYFITGSNKKIMLEHDEDFCAPLSGSSAPADSGCVVMDADAADLDMNAAYYMDQTHHATNATAWMITGQDQVDWLQLRVNTCGHGPDPMGCRIRMTHERTAVIVRGPAPHPQPHPPHK
jgi:uncharacterized protein YecT (DUF1311 family)